MKKEISSMFWADQVAERIIKTRKKKKYTIFSGITPSGIVHAGNFREILTVYAVSLALKDKGVEVDHFQSWDDYDRFRKVPGNVPKEWSKYLGLPVMEVPDPWKCHKSYAEHFEKLFMKEIDLVGIKCKHIFQNEMYKKLKYKELIKKSLLNKNKIIEILNRFRKNPLAENWEPVNIYCKECRKDTTKLLNYDNKYTIEYSCECGFKGKINFSKEGNIKLAYRVDWPMKWEYNKTDYEPAGKDLFAAGSVVETSQLIQKEVFKSEHPINMPYNQVMIKGEKTKMSSSKGNAFVIKDLLKVYTPEIIRFIYLGTKPNKEFSISFDEDVMKIYEDFYWAERIYFKKEVVNERSQNQWSRVYELSQIKKSNIPKSLSEQPKFGYCVELINLCNHDIEKAWKRVKELKGAKDKKRWISVLERASFWVKNYATDKYKVELLKKLPKIKLDGKEKKAINILIRDLKSKKWKEEKLYGRIFDICKEADIKPGKLFSILYSLLIGRKYGPRLATFILAVGQKEIVKILEKV